MSERAKQQKGNGISTQIPQIPLRLSMNNIPPPSPTSRLIVRTTRDDHQVQLKLAPWEGRPCCAVFLDGKDDPVHRYELPPRLERNFYIILSQKLLEMQVVDNQGRINSLSFVQNTLNSVYKELCSNQGFDVPERMLCRNL